VAQGVLEPGVKVAGYLLERKLGQGGMGVVYLATEIARERPVALKFLAPHLADRSEFLRRFQVEMRAVEAIRHPNIVRAHDIGIERPHHYIATSYVEGGDLKQLCDAEGALPESRALDLFGQLASALRAVHDAGFVHRDVKPANVLVANPGRMHEWAMLTDFGIVKALDDVMDATVGGPPGTPAYTAPELVLGRRPTPAADQYALACVLFEMLAGHPPYEAADRFALSQAHQEAPVPDISDIAPNVSRDVRTALARALAKDPDDRWPDVEAFAHAAGAADAFAARDSLADQLARLPEREKLVLALHTFEWLSLKDIGEVLGVTLRRIQATYDSALMHLDAESRERILAYRPNPGP